MTMLIIKQKERNISIFILSVNWYIKVYEGKIVTKWGVDSISADWKKSSTWMCSLLTCYIHLSLLEKNLCFSYVQILYTAQKNGEHTTTF